MERTFAIIKPDAVAANQTGEILSIIEAAGFRVVGMKMKRLSQREAEGFYAVHRERPFFASLVKFMTEGPAVVMVLEARDAIRKWRETMGATTRLTPPKAPSAGVSRSRSSATACTDRTRRRRRRRRLRFSSARRSCCRRSRSLTSRRGAMNSYHEARWHGAREPPGRLCADRGGGDCRPASSFPPAVGRRQPAAGRRHAGCARENSL